MLPKSIMENVAYAYQSGIFISEKIHGKKHIRMNDPIRMIAATRRYIHPWSATISFIVNVSFSNIGRYMKYATDDPIPNSARFKNMNIVEAVVSRPNTSLPR